MTNLNELTKKELLNEATEQGLEPKSKATKQELIDMIVDAQQSENATVERVLAIKRRRSTNARDDEGKVIRKGKNLSGNTPWQGKFYYFDQSACDAEAFKKAPNQVKLILDYMADAGITDEETAERGKDIVDAAKAAGRLQSKIPSANLFAYYRRLMEELGLVHAY